MEIFEEWLKEEPDHPIARHMLAACSGRDVPARASDAFVEKTFDSFAGSFDSKLAKLQYRAPALVAGMLADSDVEASKSLDVLDAGCGTGLVRTAPRAVCAPAGRRRSVGAHAGAGARTRHVYDELVKVELTAYLRDCPGSFDVIVSADTLVYFGPLEDVVAACGGRAASRRAAHLHGGGIDRRRVRCGLLHQPARPLQPCASSTSSACWRDAGLRPEIVPAELRLEAGDPVAGLVVRATKPTGAGMNHAYNHA